MKIVIAAVLFTIVLWKWFFGKPPVKIIKLSPKYADLL